MGVKTLVLVKSKDVYFFDKYVNKNIAIESVFRENSGINNSILKFLRKIKSKYTYIFYGDWYRNISSYSKIIVFDMSVYIDYRLLENIARKTSQCQKFLYSWNIVINEDKYYENRKIADKFGFKSFCYDCGNCEKFNMRFNTIMYDIKLKINNHKADNDMMFLGFLKDREEKLVKLHSSFIKAGLNPRFVIVASETQKYSFFEYRENYVSYSEYLEMLSKSRAILDISQDNQDGYSMRVMEAIFLNKKLITTNIAVKNSMFYDPHNILIINLDDVNFHELSVFYTKEFHPYDSQIRNYYSIESWVNRFK